MKLYNFMRLIQRYSVEFTLRKTESKLVSGKWEKVAESVETMRGAIVPMSDRKIHSSEGAYTTQDRELYLCKPLSGSLGDFTVTYKGNTYTVEEGRNYDDYADVAVYTLKWVSKK